jgi:threonyl-tRNA synthetase
MVIVGDREVDKQRVAVRKQSGEDLGTMGVADLVDQLSIEIERRV